MRDRNGFFLIEFVIALVLLMLSTVFFVHFFIHILKSYEGAKNRLQALQIAQNHVELLWLDGYSLPSHIEHAFIMKTRTLEMPIHTYAPTLIIPQVVYQEIEISKWYNQKNVMSITLPGYLYEKTR